LGRLPGKLGYFSTCPPIWLVVCWDCGRCAIIETLAGLDLKFPIVDGKGLTELKKVRRALFAEGGALAITDAAATGPHRKSPLRLACRVEIPLERKVAIGLAGFSPFSATLESP